MDCANAYIEGKRKIVHARLVKTTSEWEIISRKILETQYLSLSSSILFIIWWISRKTHQTYDPTWNSLNNKCVKEECDKEYHASIVLISNNVIDSTAICRGAERIRPATTRFRGASHYAGTAIAASNCTGITLIAASRYKKD